MITAVVVAAGKGLRTGYHKNKILYEYNQKPLFMYSVETFLDLGYKVVLVVSETDYELLKDIPNVKVVLGGITRTESVDNGLQSVTTKYVMIHDAARPFIEKEVILKVEEKLKQYDCVMVCKKVSNTIYDQNINVLDRESLISAETPQAFVTEKLKEAYKQYKNHVVTDDISLYKKYEQNIEVGLVMHTTNNDKITTKQDLDKLKMPSFRTGYAYDIHQTKVGRPLVLGGIEIECEFGLLGHSDADVLLHAISEAIIGALGLGDLGTHFPDTDMKYKDLDSKKILHYTKELLKTHNYQIENIDASVFLEKPKLAPYLGEMKKVICDILDISQNDLNLKAGTNEGVDAIGRKEAIASSAIVLIRSI